MNQNKNDYFRALSFKRNRDIKVILKGSLNLFAQCERQHILELSVLCPKYIMSVYNCNLISFHMVKNVASCYIITVYNHLRPLVLQRLYNHPKYKFWNLKCVIPVHF